MKKIDILDESNYQAMKRAPIDSGGKYSITLHCTDTPTSTSLLEERKWIDILSWGDEVDVKVESVTLTQSP